MEEDIHGGNLTDWQRTGWKEQDVLDFSVNLNPLGQSEKTLKILRNPESRAENYPETHQSTEIFAKSIDCPADTIMLTSGATEAFSLILQALKSATASWVAPGYSGYEEVCKANSIEASPLFMDLDDDHFSLPKEKIISSSSSVIFIGSPNNPTGHIVPKSDILDIADKKPETFFVIDESFIDFLPDSQNQTLIGHDIPKNIIVVKSLTKFFSIAGLRAGFIYANPSIITKINKCQLPWTVNGLCQDIISTLYTDKRYIEETINRVNTWRESFQKELSEINELTVYSASANFILCRLQSSAYTSKTLQQILLKEHGIYIRSCHALKGLDASFFRVAVKHEPENMLLVNALRTIFGHDLKEYKSLKKPAVMIVGTTSNAGKSLVAAAFCRYFSNAGINTAPYKAQNMSLNSFVTKEGGEIGRAQVVQAEAARIEPHTDMNPVLLKPLGNSSSQVIVNGKAWKNSTAKNYYTHKTVLYDKACDAYSRLADKHDVIVLEGAGSPTEINLLDNDFVNMRMAEHADAYTILVADIDRGGVFASIYGTIKLLPPKWQKLIKGIVINKFRGDASLLDNGIKEIEELTGVPVLGILPYLTNITIEEEDSVALQDKSNDSAAENQLDIVIIKLPRMSNYTDFLALETHPQCNVRYVENPRKIGTPDLIILPGTKNTISDLLWLRETGLESRIKVKHSEDTPVIGICGGYQMMGSAVYDPHGVEGNIESANGLGLLDCVTTLEKEKELAQVTAESTDLYPFSESTLTIKGYEIHAGTTKTTTDSPLTLTSRRDDNVNEICGTVSENKLAFGCYIHGFFDDINLRTELLKHLLKQKNVGELVTEDSKELTQDESLDIIAQSLKDNLDLNAVNKFVGM